MADKYMSGSSGVGGLSSATKPDYIKRGSGVDADGVPTIIDTEEELVGLPSEQTLSGAIPQLSSEPIRGRLESAMRSYISSKKALDEETKRIDSVKVAASKLINSVSYSTTAARRLINSGDVASAMKQINSMKASIKNVLEAHEVDDIVMSEKLDNFMRSDIAPEDVEAAIRLVEDSIEELESASKNGVQYEKMFSKTQQMRSAQKRYEGVLQDAMRASIGDNEVKAMWQRIEENLGQRSPYDIASKNEGELIPNYRQAMPEASRMCLNCRFFQTKPEGDTGHCEIYHVDVYPNYICDAWQSTTLTESHTPVRQGRVKARKAPLAPHKNPDWQSGHVPSVLLEDVDNSSVTGWRQNELVDYNAVSRKNILPNDFVYSKSLNSMAQVQSLEDYDGVRYYTLKLLNAAGIPVGTAVTPQSDLNLRSSAAIKHLKSALEGSITEGYESIKALEDDIESMVESVRAAYRAVDTVYQNCKSSGVSIDDLTPLHDELIKMHEAPEFQNVKTGRRRKYLRALEHAMYSVGAARGLLFESGRALGVNTSGDRKALANNIMKKAASDAIERIEIARKYLYDSLSLPSATHGDAPAGIKYHNGVKTAGDIVWDAFERNEVTLKSDEIDEFDSPDGIAYTIRKPQDELSLEEMRSIVSDAGLTVKEYYRERVKGIIYNTVIAE